MQASGQTAPELPPPIPNEINQRLKHLDSRKGELERYLKKVLNLLVCRAPLPLLQFLSLQDQSEQITFARTD